MELTVRHSFLLYISPYTSAIKQIQPNHHHLHIPNLRPGHTGSAMRAGLTLYRSPSHIIATTSCRVRPQKFMATNDPSGIQMNESEKKDTARKEREEKSAKSLPPPPEKPFPDDCCGSGCVRCVWDVYYEELEAYEKLLQDNSVSNS